MIPASWHIAQIPHLAALLEGQGEAVVGWRAEAFGGTGVGNLLKEGIALAAAGGWVSPVSRTYGHIGVVDSGRQMIESGEFG